MNAWKAVSLLFVGLVISLLAVSAAAEAASFAAYAQLEASEDDVVKGCLPADALVLGGAMLGSPAKPALRRLGNPLSVRTSSGEDDGGR